MERYRGTKGGHAIAGGASTAST
ncbi:MAG: hypothetical protein JWP25_753, partial [Bradyrhizobium sp.]|nr:hypothetical protein [Bradyrhizobium sp.]